MSMFCYQCQEAAKGTGCTIKGVCGKDDVVSAEQDLLIYALKGLSWAGETAAASGVEISKEVGRFIMYGLFTTITNANFDSSVFNSAVTRGLAMRDELLDAARKAGWDERDLPGAAAWQPKSEAEYPVKAAMVGVLATENEDIRSLRELVIYGLKGLAAYTEHAEKLGKEDKSLYTFARKALSATLDDSLSLDELVALTLETGEKGVTAMALLDSANTGTYGNPEITEVNIGVGDRPGILISGHDLRDLKELLEQSKNSGIDIYTHSEMLPAHYYPELKAYGHLKANYGSSWWQQNKEFESFNGPVLLTTNCLVPPKESYKNRLYTSGAAGFPGVSHIADRIKDEPKDFSAIIEQAKTCPPPTELESGSIVGGFAHAQVLALADQVVDAVNSGAIKRFFVMAGCDGRQKGRNYYSEFAEELPEDTVILTAGCAKFRYNKLDLGDIGGIPRVLDAGQCNDSYSLVVIAMKLKEVFGLDDINDLPISYNIAWYEQKAVIVLLALLHLGVKDIHLGPTLPAFLSPNVVKVLVDNFGIAGIGESVQEDIELFMETREPALVN
ncbi:MAG: hydroxylamine reductase [Spirochaetes bacterium]|nr:MAG: hydroxylamine reductase [Spirochaetota bacterium]